MIYFLIPFYNESKNLKEFCSSIKNATIADEKYYIFVDDCSTDNGCEIIENEMKNTKFLIINKDRNYGPGHSFNIGFNRIIECCNDHDIIVTMEADNTSDIAILPAMISISSLGYDLVLASIYAQGGGLEKTSFLRKILSFSANLFFRFMLNVKVLTQSSFYRVYKAATLKRIKQKYSVIILNHGFSCMLEILVKAIAVDAKIIEVPMLLKSHHRIGKSKMKIFRTIKEYLIFFLKIKKMNA